MLDRQRGHIIFECDVCGDTLETDMRDFTEARTAFNNEGWRSRKLGADWIHYCAECGVKER